MDKKHEIQRILLAIGICIPVAFGILITLVVRGYQTGKLLLDEWIDYI